VDVVRSLFALLILIASGSPP